MWIANDAYKVSVDHNVSVKTLEDLSELANKKFDEEPKKWSLASLTEKLLAKQVFFWFLFQSYLLLFYFILCFSLPPFKILELLGGWEGRGGIGDWFLALFQFCRAAEPVLYR